MGEMADAILEGECCQLCGVFFDEPTGSPTTCGECRGEGKREWPNDHQRTRKPKRKGA